MSGVIGYFKQAWDELLAPDSGFAISEQEVLGFKMKVFNQAPANMRVLWELATLHGDKTYVVYEDERYSYAQIDARVRALAHYLRDQHGVGSGDRVAVAMRNYPEWLVSYWAVVSIGAAVVGMNAWWTGPEMEFGLTDSKPKVLIADRERLATVGPHLDAIRANSAMALIGVRLPEDASQSEGTELPTNNTELPTNNTELPTGIVRWEDVVNPDEAPAGLPETDIDPDDDVTIFYTSGTTGFPKGAQLTHRGSVHNVLNIAFLSMVGALAEAKQLAASGQELPVPSDPATVPQKVFMAPTPLFHVTACNCLMHPATLTGSTLVLMYKWDTARALELIEREGVTNFSGVPTMSREMLLHQDWDKRDTSTLETLGGGGAPLQPDLVSKIDQAIPQGAPSTGYGLTETNGIITAVSAQLYVDKPASCGPVVPTLDYKLIDELGNDLPEGSTGELCVKGPIVIKGYINREEATAEAIQDGWFRTGDIANIDEDGFVFLVDRAKDMVLRGGENVYCSEVEAAIYRHPDIAEAAVFGLPDERLGEEVAAAIVLQPGSKLDEAGLVEFMAPQIAKFKIPTRVWFRTEPLPQNANGKFLKKNLREELLEQG